VKKWLRELVGIIWSVIRFWLVVLWHSLIAPFKTIKDTVVIGVILMIGSLISAILAVNGYIDKSIAEGYLSDVSSVVRLLAILGVAYLILIVLGILYYPAKLYNDARRRGKIVVGTPSTYSALAHPKDDFLLVKFPLIFSNISDTPIVVRNLQLTLEQNGTQSPVLYFNKTFANISTKEEDGVYREQFIVDGKCSKPVVCEFLRKPRGGFVFSSGDCTATLEGKFDNGQRWETIAKFLLHVHGSYVQQINSVFTPIVYDNDPDRQY
jgi:hypothetical protein